MSNTHHNPFSAGSRAQLMGQYLWDEFAAERWTLRKLEARTGIGKNVLSSRFKGKTELGFHDVEVFAEVLKRDPVELFATLRKLPDLDSNQEPAGFKSAPKIRALRLVENTETTREPRNIVRPLTRATLHNTEGHKEAILSKLQPRR